MEFFFSYHNSSCLPSQNLNKSQNVVIKETITKSFYIKGSWDHIHSEIIDPREKQLQIYF